MRWLDSNTESMDMNLSKLQKIVENRGAWCVIVHKVAQESDNLVCLKTSLLPTCLL